MPIQIWLQWAAIAVLVAAMGYLVFLINRLFQYTDKIYRQLDALTYLVIQVAQNQECKILYKGERICLKPLLDSCNDGSTDDDSAKSKKRKVGFGCRDTGETSQ